MSQTHLVGGDLLVLSQWTASKNAAFQNLSVCLKTDRKDGVKNTGMVLSWQKKKKKPQHRKPLSRTKWAAASGECTSRSSPVAPLTQLRTGDDTLVVTKRTINPLKLVDSLYLLMKAVSLLDRLPPCTSQQKSTG